MILLSLSGVRMCNNTLHSALRTTTPKYCCVLSSQIIISRFISMVVEHRKKRSASDATLKQPIKNKKDEEKIYPRLSNKGFSSNTTFHKSKIIVCINFESPQLMIKYAQNEFLDAFLYSRDRLSFFPFSLITGVSTPHEFLNAISVAVQTEKTANECISLYRSNGTALSCHVSVMSITNRFLDAKLVPLDLPQTLDSTKWAVITVNSAIITDPIDTKIKGGEILESYLMNQGTLTEVKTARSKGKTKDGLAAIIDQKLDCVQEDNNHEAVDDMTEKQFKTVDCSCTSSILDGVRDPTNTDEV